MAWVVPPDRFISFMNRPVSGMDLNALRMPGSFSLLGFLNALSVTAIWPLPAGALNAWLRQRLGA